MPQVPITHIQDQAAVLGLDLIVVPTDKVGKGTPALQSCDDSHGSSIAQGNGGDEGSGYLDSVSSGLALLAPTRVERLVFGDLHLRHIRDWRESNFGPGGLGYNCHFPLWGRPYDELLAMLAASGAHVTIRSVYASVMCGPLDRHLNAGQAG